MHHGAQRRRRFPQLGCWEVVGTGDHEAWSQLASPQRRKIKTKEREEKKKTVAREGAGPPWWGRGDVRVWVDGGVVALRHSKAGVAHGVGGRMGR